VIFIDAGAVIARYRLSDAWNKQALQGWAELDKSNRRAFTSNLVIAESLKIVYQFAGAGWTGRIAREIIQSTKLHILRPGPAEELQAITLMEKFADQGIGFIDCVSIVLMRQRRLNSVFSFDKHFNFAGFKLWPTERH
jgi:predicted nucleic acid-binding protein